MFELSTAGRGWKATVLYNLTMDQGALSLNGSPVLDSHGNLYAVTTYNGPPPSHGTVFKLSPAKKGQWTYKLLYAFSGPDGSNPIGGPTLDAARNIYGTTEAGGAYTYGAVFELVAKGGGNYSEKVLWNFNLSDGLSPSTPVILDSSGNLYGITSSGGAYGNGNVFEITRREAFLTASL